MSLMDFAKRREQSILEQYEAEFTEKQRGQHEAEIENLSKARTESPRSFTKLLLLYLQDPGVLGKIHHRHLWREARSTAEYETDAWPDDAHVDLRKAIKTLIAELKKLPEGKQLKFHGMHELENGPRVYILQRAYKPKVMPEFPNTFHVFNGYGHIVFGLYDAPARLEIKVGNQKYIRAIRDWAAKTLKVTLRSCGLSVFESYDAAELEKRLLGEHSEEHGLAVIGIRLRRTAMPNHPAVTIEASSGKATIRDALTWYREKGVISLRSLSDVEWLRVHFGGQEGLINVVLMPDGSVRFELDNTGWLEATRASLGVAFERTFGIPLSRHIDAKPLTLGALEMFQSLLEWGDADEIHPHQRGLFEFLKDRKLLTVRREVSRTCTTASCKKKGKSVDDPNVENCTTCHLPLRVKQAQKIIHEEDGIRSFVGLVLKRATGWDLARTSVQFENNEFYPLRNPVRPEESLCVFLSRRVSSSKIQVFDRSMWPILVVHTSGTYEHAHLDIAGIAHLGLAYALAATREKDVRDLFFQDCKSLVERLQRNEQERVLRAARQSRDLLGNEHSGCSGGAYESAVFGLLRSLFPHTMKWGGKFKPDGFCSLVYSTTNQLKDLEKWNWSYDSKYSERHGGYEFGASEHRKLFDYVKALSLQKELQVQGNQMDAHVILSNSLEPTKMKDAARFLRCEHRLGRKDLGSFKLVFMMEPFLLTLYDRVRTKEMEYMKRWGYLSQRFAWQMQQENADGYVRLDAREANELADWVEGKSAVENPALIAQIKDDLDEMMSGK